jgi:class II lanthipeptide synthase
LVPDVSLAIAEVLRRTAWRGGTLTFDGEVVTTRRDPRGERAEKLAKLFYHALYVPGIDASGRIASGIGEAQANERAIDAAVAAAGTWLGIDRGWTIVEANDRQIVLEREGLRVFARPDDVELPQAPSLSGAGAGMRNRGGMAHISPGFRYFFGPVALSYDDAADPLFRIYFAIRPSASADLTREIGATLAAIGAPFEFKIATADMGCQRADAAVLYVARSTLEAHSDAIAGIGARLAPGLADATPLFSRRLSHGVGLAQSPPGGESFGQARCASLAGAVLDVMSSVRAKPLAECIERRLRLAGVDPEHPHLFGSPDPFPAAVLEPPAAPRSRPHRQSPEAAIAAIAHEIADRAIVHDGRATWLAPPPGTASAGRLQTLGADYYSGLSGVASFLAEAGHLLDDRRLSGIAAAALDQALDLAETDAAVPPGLYTGMTGAALALARLDRRSLAGPGRFARATSILRRKLAAENRDEQECDLLHGWSGTAAGIERLVAHGAIDAGDPLIERVAARLDQALAKERTAGRSRSARLTGISHGMGGKAIGLAASAKLTGKRAQARRAQALALALQEVGEFERAERNWPDRRYRRPSFQFAWCHGSPGVLLAHRTLAQGYGMETLPADIRTIAEAAIAERLGALPGAGSRDWCLCHGAAGLIELADELAIGGSEAGAAWLVERTNDRSVNDSWPLVGGGTDPGLLCGLSGIGLFLLRRIDPCIPSALTLGLCGVT